MISVSFRGRILSGAFDCTLGCLVAHELNVPVFGQGFAAAALFVR